MTVTVQLKGIEAARRQLSVEQFHTAVAAYTGEAGKIALARAKARAPGHFPGTLGLFVVGNGLWARVASSSHQAVYVESGRKPGGPFPPVAAIEGWMNRVGINAASFVVGRAIARRGIKGRFFMRAARRAVIAARAHLEKTFVLAWKL